MKPSPVPVVSHAPTPISGTLTVPVNAIFTGPNADGVLNDVPPLVASGTEFVPLVAINGTNQNKLGVSGGESPKTHG